MRRQKKQYQGPAHPWQAARIAEEADLVKRYGLKNKKEIWRAQSKLRNWRAQARRLVGLPAEEVEGAKAALFGRLIRLGLITDKSSIDDILTLGVDQVLGLRLQTSVQRKGLSTTVKQARQFIVHKKVLVNGNVTTSPSYEVRKDDVVELLKGFEVKSPPKQQEVVEEVKKDGE